MKEFLVGGAIRDRILGIANESTEKDFVVVGSSPEEMSSLGFRQVGKEFPVFLHPETKDEYALARIERKIGRGYKGFAFDTANSVTLEQDLSRRDLTINAIALNKDGTGEYIDPFDGIEDLKQKKLRHVSDAFTVTDNIPFHEAGLLKLNCDKSLAFLGWQAALDYRDTIKFTSEWYYDHYKKGTDMMAKTISQINEYQNIAYEKGLSWT